jgi:hypothetical protein
MSKAEAGRLGGLKTYERHGHAHYVAMGEKGGRPRSLTISEIKQKRREARASELKRARGLGVHRALKVLLEQWA